ncbi:MAG: hypothetical protein WCK35_17435 [Chloroflexota bacterium]
MTSKYFWTSTIKGLNRIGDVFIPQDSNLPSFSQFNGVEHVDDMIAFLPVDDLQLLNIALTVLSVMPDGFLKWLVSTMEEALDKTGSIPSILRQLNLGLRGIIFSCYYSGKAGSDFRGENPLDVLGYHLNRVEE